MRTVNFDDLDDLPAPGTQNVEPTAVPADEPDGRLHGTGTVDSPSGVFTEIPLLDDHVALTFGPLEADFQGLVPAPTPGLPPEDLGRSIHAANTALQSPSHHLGISVQTVLENYGRLTPSQVEALHGVLMELGADNDEGGEAYGPDFDMTGFIQGMIRTTRKIEQRLYRPGEDGMTASFTAQELGGIINANKNLMTLIARHHDKVMGWERQRAVEAAHLAAARELPVDLQDKYLARLQAELEARGL
jgi:hypothetical protein